MGNSYSNEDSLTEKLAVKQIDVLTERVNYFCFHQIYITNGLTCIIRGYFFHSEGPGIQIRV
ncbi:MAG: hypothetical protein A4E70_01433 [Syntrophus sp. PtaU1.Bin005]|nr:MAG: hypothetical protein A4E70_01433 [Syntrophus sp. PtaU1.Bin005]